MKLKLQLLALSLLMNAAASHAQGTIAFLNPPTVLFPYRAPDGSVVGMPTAINSTLNYGIFIGPSADALSDQPAGPLATGSPTLPGRITLALIFSLKARTK